MFYEQAEYDIRCEWGLAGINNLGSGCDVIVVVDVLSFTTCVDVAVGRGAIIYPFAWADQSVEVFASKVGAMIAQRRGTTGGYTLSPASLEVITPGVKLVLPSPNGSALSLSTGGKPTLAGCLRNAGAVARAAAQMGKRILVVPAGERWHNKTLRPSLEDLAGAGAIIHHLAGSKSPEAAIAESVYLSVEQDIGRALAACSSGKELIERGYGRDVEIAAQVNASECVPTLVDGAYRPYAW